MACLSFCRRRTYSRTEFLRCHHDGDPKQFWLLLTLWRYDIKYRDADESRVRR
ncbi:Uncharacterised protein [Vibrio cholerae]|nr:Uncharacterised protein [Vibrio cholerae]